MTTTFTYIHPTVGPIQHKVTRLIEHKNAGNSVRIVFEDDKKRRLSITTNQPYSLRSEAEINERTETAVGQGES